MKVYVVTCTFDDGEYICSNVIVGVGKTRQSAEGIIHLDKQKEEVKFPLHHNYYVQEEELQD